MNTMKNKKTKILKNSRKSKLLIIFLAVSFLFWMLIKLSKEYTTVIQLNINYINLAKGKILQKEPDKLLDVVVKTYGFNLIKYRLYKRSVTIDLKSVRKKKGLIYYQLSGDLLPEIQQQIAADVEVIAVQPDTLYYHLGISKTKKILVVPKISIQYQTGYNLLGDLKIEPNFVSVSGPEAVVDTITVISTKPIKLTDINAPFEVKIPILTLDNTTNIRYSVNKVVVSGRVDKFTEARLKLPFEIRNLPKSKKITTFPDLVEVVFHVGIADYNKINKNDFKISCDYNRTLKDGLNYLIPEIIAKPEIASEIKIIPNQIEYLIKE